MLILDGLGDLPIAALGGRTPLEAADTPVMDRLASSGWYGLVDPEKPGKVPSTHTGCGLLLGVPPGEMSRMKRGPVEASGAGRILETGDIAIRANFSTLEQHPDGLRVIDRRAGRITGDTPKLAAALKNVDLGDGIFADLVPTDQHRCVLVLTGSGLDPHVSDTDPGDRGMPGFVKVCKPGAVNAERTAEKINLFLKIANDRLSEHPVNQARARAGQLPANGVITRGAGAAMAPENMVRDRGISAALVAGCNTVIGLAKTLKFDVLSQPGFTADAHTDLQQKMHTAVAAMERHDLVYVHIKAPDLFAHDHDPEGKRDFLERVDSALGILEQAGVMIALSADHSTDSNTGAHTADPVPALLYDPAAITEGAAREVKFGEQACASGNMPRQTGHSLLLSLLGRMAANAK